MQGCRKHSKGRGTQAFKGWGYTGIQKVGGAQAFKRLGSTGIQKVGVHRHSGVPSHAKRATMEAERGSLHTNL